MTEQANGRSIKVLIGQVALTRSPNRLETVLGSCIGLVLYDPVEYLAGMAHVLLPASSGRASSDLPGKYADQAVPCLYEGMLRHGALPNRIKAKLAGGASMFANNQLLQRNDVGASNAEAVRSALKALRIPIVAIDVGGTVGRKAWFDIDRFDLHVEPFAQRATVL